MAKVFNSQESSLGLRADELLARAAAVRHSTHSKQDVEFAKDSESSAGPQNNLADAGPSRDYWEALADSAPDEILTSDAISALSSLTIDEPKTLSYQRGELYGESITEDAVGEDASQNQEENTDKIISNYGIIHVLVLAEFIPSTRTSDLEKYFEDFREREFVIRWVNDTCAIAVFKTPSIALEAFNRNRCPFTVRILGEDDAILNSLNVRDLEPLGLRPQTTSRVAQRLTAHGMGLKLPQSTFGSGDF